MMMENVIPFRNEFKLKYLGVRLVNPECFYRLQWTKNRSTFFIYRSLMMIYSLGWFVCDVVTNSDVIYYAYVSHWTELLQVVYFVSSFINALFHLHQSRRVKVDGTGASANSVSRPNNVAVVLRAIWVLFNVSGASSIGVAILYWSGRIYNMIGSSNSAMSVTVHVHVTCCLMTIIELMVTDIHIRLMHFYQISIFSIIYLAFTALLHAVGVTSAIYKVLDWESNPGIALLCALCGSLGVAPILHFVFMYGFYRLRRFLARAGITPPDGRRHNKPIYNNATLPGV